MVPCVLRAPQGLFTVPSSSSHFEEAKPPAHRGRGGAVPSRASISTGLPRLDPILGDLKSGTVSLIEGNHPFISEVLSLLAINAVTHLGKPVVYVDGGNSIDPYLIATLAKRSGVKPAKVLPQILVARAFTAYQLDTIISDRLEAVLDQAEPELLVIACITDLFMDRAVAEKEALAMLRRCVARIETSTLDRQLITVVTKRRRAPSSRALAFDEILAKLAEERISVERRKKGAVRLRQHTRGILMDYVPLSIYQTTLDEFIGGGT
jgi:predicted ATP-dependent serine protease